MKYCASLALLTVVILIIAACVNDPYYSSGYRRANRERVRVTEAPSTPAPSSFDRHIEPADPSAIAPPPQQPPRQ